jgi:uncharacterized protein (UPF0548 family)
MPVPDLWERPVSYGAVGATKAADLLTYPPVGYRPFEGRVRIGHGDARWQYAWTSVLSWRVQRNSGFTVEVSDTPHAVTESTYTPVSFDPDGTPAVPASIAALDEHIFAPDGTALIAPGVTAVLSAPFGPFRVKAPARVVYVVDEPKRKGFAYGTMAGHPEKGEESFIVEQTDDGSVWLEIRAFSRPANGFYWLVYPILRVSQAFYTRRYFNSLSGPID